MVHILHGHIYTYCGCGYLNHNNPLDKNWMGWRRSVRSCGRKNLRKYLCALWESRVLVLGGQVNHKTVSNNQQVNLPSKDSCYLLTIYNHTHTCAIALCCAIIDHHHQGIVRSPHSLGVPPHSLRRRFKDHIFQG